jgi:glycine/D-amino acid oxidase-like deaminating enzyme
MPQDRAATPTPALPADSATNTWDEHHDVVVLGAGAGGMTAAAVAAGHGLDVLLLEKTPLAGGTAAISGGMVWVPGNAKAAAVGQPDSLAAARRYLGHLVSGDHNAPVREAFLMTAAPAIDWLEAHTAVRLQPVPVYPDYYPELPGAALGGRVLEPVPYDARLLGRAFALLRPPLPEFTLFGGMMVPRADLVHFRNIGCSWRSSLRVAGLAGQYLWQRRSHPRGTSLVLGNALAARLLESVIRLGVDLRVGVAAEALLRDAGGAVCGVLAGGRRIAARRGVVLATGGFSHNPRWRAALLPREAGTLSAASAGNRGDGLDLGRAAGAAIEDRGDGGAFWAPVSCFRRPDASAGVFPHTVTDRGKPGVIAVDARGCRFVNEAVSYHEFVRAMLHAGDAGPVFLICDRRFLWRYGLGAIHPFCLSLRHWKKSGYLHAAADIRTLAVRLRLDPERLAATVMRFNRSALFGEDPEFGRGGDAYQRYLGDPQHAPNPCVRAIEHAPFYAVALYPADLGTSTGLATDAAARVLDSDGRPIAGLYACGNDMNSVMNGAYPGPGITLGPALTFGYIAARSLCGDNQQR